MTITDDIVKGLRNPTPLYAVAGAADLAAEKLREVPPLVGKLREQAPVRIEQLREQAPVRIEKLRATDPKAVQERVTAQAKDAQSKLNETFAELDLKKFGESVQNAALHGVGRAAEAAVKVRETYDELAVRGKGAVANWRGQAADEVVEIAAVVEPEPEPKAQEAKSATATGDEAGAEAEAEAGAGDEPKPATAKKPAARRSTPKKAAEQSEQSEQGE